MDGKQPLRTTDLTRLGEPPRVTARDRVLIEWVARAAIGDPLPEPWCHAREPTESVIRILVELHVIAAPPPGSTWKDVVTDAGAAARAWLQVNPPQPSPPREPPFSAPR
jgi:hypothetical protein